ncbi:hypothetical protein ISN45_At04g010620 [Arabidopsis thaliana x Arabidopsis arenosa]|uniref:Uncharacterized protein n=2 Tax=Arabidopsis TaxID=3701 RepID=A0A8T2E7D8_ARASU|nr:hypothetical protein ISN45_At04g010620 [Arabidopsis thaliana x Arabidopsis arenosa]KAG7619998.1 hypothetical protein ISN44_As04g010220 [Arabidopsis suecica]
MINWVYARVKSGLEKRRKLHATPLSPQHPIQL